MLKCVEKCNSPEFENAKKWCLRANCEESMGMSLKESPFYGDFENKQQEKWKWAVPELYGFLCHVTTN